MKSGTDFLVHKATVTKPPYNTLVVLFSKLGHNKLLLGDQSILTAKKYNSLV
jgi:hypothetical protein